MRSPGRTLVVDADIACAAGPDPKTRPWTGAAKAAHDVLYAIRESRGHRVAFDRTLLGEWREHQGRTASAWFAAMLSAGRVHDVPEIDAGWIDPLIGRDLP